MKGTLLFFMLCIIAVKTGAAGPLDSVSARLRDVLDNRAYYDAEKEKQIGNLKKRLTAPDLPPLYRYEVHTKLYEAYNKYQVDSAVHYVLENKKIAEYLHNDTLLNTANTYLAGLYASKGLYIEAKGLLDHINRTGLSKELLPIYYTTYKEFCSHYGQSNGNDEYYHKSETYQDSLMALLDTASLQFQIVKATRILYKGQMAAAKATLLKLLDKTTDSDPERALIAYLLGIIYKDQADVALQKQYFSMSAIADILNSIKDNASLQSLALTYYNQGEVDEAYRFIEAAITDAVFCNARYRTVEGSTFYPIINASFREKEQHQKTVLVMYLIAISILSLILIAGLVFIYYQMKKLSKTRKELFRTNEKLNTLNLELQKTNNSLSESDHIKQEYIANFFDICSSYIDKLESYRRALHKKALSSQHEALLKDLKSTDLVENELAELYKNFDSIFLNLYPSFVQDFNSLLQPEEQIHLKVGELLNNELRIFALVRLGVTDSVKIANFLRYSLRTVYNYRTRVRGKSAVPREEFDERIRQIGNLRRV